MSCRIILVLCSVVASCVWCPLGNAQTIVIPPNRDGMLIENGVGSLASGSGGWFCVGNTNQSGNENTRRGIVFFDIAEVIPAGSVILDVSLRLRMSQSNSGAQTISLHRVPAPWGEGASFGSGCQGVNSADQDVTWTHRFFDAGNPGASVFWNNPGGDFDAVPSASASVAFSGLYTWTSPQLIDDVQNWLDDPSSNHGWLLRGNESTNATSKRFDSRENSTPAFRPALTIEYLALDPPGACCFGDGDCQFLTEGDCINAGGNWLGGNTDCSPNLCPQPTGACCFADQTCQELTESDCVAQGGSYFGDGVPCSPSLCPLVLTPYLDPLPIPAVAVPVSMSPGGPVVYELNMTEISHSFHSELPPTRVWGHEGSYPGPTIAAERDQEVEVVWGNDLRDEMGVLRSEHYLPVDLCLTGPSTLGATARTVPHVHGAHVESASVGLPDAGILPGQSVTYQYPNQQEAATLWYRDQALGITRLNRQMGLAGFYLIRDPNQASLQLPSGSYDIPLLLEDRTVRTDGSVDYPADWRDDVFGRQHLVNGKILPFLIVDRGKYRFRVVNGSNSRTYRLSLSHGAPFWLLGTDGGLLESPGALPRVTLGPGERADLVVDFGGLPIGTSVELLNDAPAPFVGGTAADPAAPLLRFIVNSFAGFTDPLPFSLVPVETLNENDAALERTIELDQLASPCGAQIWTLGGAGWGSVTESPEWGTTEVWSFVNRTEVALSVHLAQVRFQVLDRQAFELQGMQVVPIGPAIPAAFAESGWKDTVLVEPGQIARIIVEFEDYFGTFFYHVQNAEQCDHEMVRPFEVVVNDLDFVRIDVNADGALDVADAIAALDYVFSGGMLTCPNAADANDDENLDVADVVGILSFLFQMATPPPAPFPNCGIDPTTGALGCDAFAACP